MHKRIGFSIVGVLLAAIALAGSGLKQGLPEFQPVDAEEEGYWYSRYNLGNLVMRSGLGLTFKPPAEVVQRMMQAVDANPGDGNAPAVRKGITLLKLVYTSGDPHYTTKLNPSDFDTQHWDPAGFEKRTTASASGWTIMKEAEWAKQFHVDDHFGTPASDFGAQWRFVGMIMNASAKTQAKYLATQMTRADGLIPSSDGGIDWIGQWVMLEAYANLADYLAAPTLPHSASNRYRNPQAAGFFAKAADRLYAALTHRQPQGARELSQAVQALTWYAALKDDNGAVKGLLRSQALQLTGRATESPGELAYKVRGLVEAWRATGDAFFQRVAARSYKELVDGYNFDHGMFKGARTHTIDDVAAIMGAINASRLFLGDAIDQDRAERFFANFFESAVNLSGLQQSVPPVPVAKGKFEQDEPPLYYGYPTIPKPPMAGGSYGVAPVFATRIAWNENQRRFEVDDPRFDTAGTMHASNEFIWFHNDEVNGFPEVK